MIMLNKNLALILSNLHTLLVLFLTIGTTILGVSFPGLVPCEILSWVDNLQPMSVRHIIGFSSTF